MPDEIRPALSAEEWAEKRYVRFFQCDVSVSDGTLTVGSDVDGICVVHLGAERHAVAALALHGQPFGFTQEDVEAISSAEAWARYDNDDPEMAKKFRSLLTRIAALLPPEDSGTR